MGRQNQVNVTFRLGGRDLGKWSAREGGGLDSDPTLHYPGGMEPPVSLGAQPATDDVTIRKLETNLSDDDLAYLLDAQGSSLAGIVVRQRLDGRNAATRRPMTWRGTVRT